MITYFTLPFFMVADGITSHIAAMFVKNAVQQRIPYSD